MTQEMELVHVDPAKLVIDVNVRTVVDIDPSFYESIRDTGVQQPPKGWRDDDGNIVIEVGQRRVLAAVKAKLGEIPVIVVTREAAESEKAAKAARIVRQLSENDHRAGLTDAEHVAAYRELTLFGLSADQIAKETKTKRDRVRAAVHLTKTAPAVTEAMATTPVTLDQALVISEFDADEPRRRELLEIAEKKPDDLVFAAERMRREIADEAMLAAEIEKVAADGLSFVSDAELEERKDDWATGFVFIEDVYLSDDVPRPPTPEEAAERGGLRVGISWYGSWDYESRSHIRNYERDYYIETPGAFGYADPSDHDADAAGESDEERELRERREAEDAKRAELAAAWMDASAVRERWIINELLCAKKAPAGMLAWVTGLMLGVAGHNSWEHERAELKKRIAGWLGIKGADGAVSDDDFTAYASARVADEWKLPLAMVIANQEKRYLRHLDASYAATLPRTARYLVQLQEWGHTLSSVERGIVDSAEQLQTENEAA